MEQRDRLLHQQPFGFVVAHCNGFAAQPVLAFQPCFFLCFVFSVWPLISLVLLALLLFRYFVFAYKINLVLYKNRIKLNNKLIGMIGGFLLMLPWLLLLRLDLPSFFELH